MPSSSRPGHQLGNFRRPHSGRIQRPATAASKDTAKAQATPSSRDLSDDLFSLGEMRSDPFYSDFLAPNGVQWGAGTLIPVPTGDMLAVTVEGSSDPVRKEIVNALDSLRPHLARSALLSARLGLERARTQVEVPQQIGLPAAILHHTGEFSPLTPNLRNAGEIHIGAEDKIQLSDARANSLFNDALARLPSCGHEAAVWSIAIPRNGYQPPSVIHILPVRQICHRNIGLMLLQNSDALR